MTVTGCHACPLFDEATDRFASCRVRPPRAVGAGSDFSAHEMHYIRLARLKQDWPEAERAAAFSPAWCPLRTAPLIVELKL